MPPQAHHDPPYVSVFVKVLLIRHRDLVVPQQQSIHLMKLLQKVKLLQRPSPSSALVEVMVWIDCPVNKRHTLDVAVKNYMVGLPLTFPAKREARRGSRTSFDATMEDFGKD